MWPQIWNFQVNIDHSYVVKYKTICPFIRVFSRKLWLIFWVILILDLQPKYLPYVKSDVINGCSVLKKLTLIWQICQINIRHLIDFGAELTYSLIFCLHSFWKLPNLSHPNQGPKSMEDTVIPQKILATTIEYWFLLSK